MNGMINAFLNRIEQLGNRLPHPAVLFIWLCGITLLLSLVTALLGVQAIHPISGETIVAKSLLSGEGLHWIVTHTVSNFIQFAPVGIVLVAVMAVAIAERSELLGTLLQLVVIKAPRSLLSYTLVFTGVLSSLAADSGYVVLIPFAALAFKAVGLPPLAGIAAAFAGISGGFSANLMIGPLDAVLAGISTEAVHLVDTHYSVSAAHNYYFMVASTLLITLVGGWVTERLIIPRLGGIHSPDASLESLTPTQHKGLRAVALFSLLFVALLLATLLPEQGILRHPEHHTILRSPFISGIVTIISLYIALAGLIYGRIVGSLRSMNEMVEGMEESMVTMASYLVLMFFAAQFVNYFGWSQLGAILAIVGAETLKEMQLSPLPLMLGFILMAATINLLIGSASAKWALLAPIFIPMLYLLGIAPEATQVAFRIGDSVTNIITPLMPYFGVVITFARQHDKNLGVGTLMATMIPYSVVLLIGWSLLLGAWIALDWPLGPGAMIQLTAP